MNTEIRDKYQGLFSIVYSANRHELSGALQFLSKHRRVAEFDLISKKGNIAMVFYKMIQTSMFRKTSKLGFRIHPIVARDGKEKWFYINSPERVLNEDEVNDHFTSIISMKTITQERFFREYPNIFFRLHMAKVITALSGEEVSLLKKAEECGFFDWPRRTSLTVLSRQLETSKSTLSYHVRSIERKMVKLISQDMSTST